MSQNKPRSLRSVASFCRDGFKHKRRQAQENRPFSRLIEGQSRGVPLAEARFLQSLQIRFLAQSLTAQASTLYTASPLPARSRLIFPEPGQAQRGQGD